MAQERKSCRHCGHEPAHRPRGLCWVCHRTRAIRELYSRAVYGGTGEIPDRNGGYRQPPTWTDALAGSPEKVAVLERRALAGVSLWHPRDNTDVGGDFAAYGPGVMGARA